MVEQLLAAEAEADRLGALYSRCVHDVLLREAASYLVHWAEDAQLPPQERTEGHHERLAEAARAVDVLTDPGSPSAASCEGCGDALGADAEPVGFTWARSSACPYRPGRTPQMRGTCPAGATPIGAGAYPHPPTHDPT